MPILYAVKHVFRSWKLFLALLIGVTLASAFFAGIDIKASATAKQALDQDLEGVYVDMQATLSNIHGVNSTQMLPVLDKVENLTGIAGAEIISRVPWVQMKVFDKNFSASYAKISAVSNNSRVYDGWLNKPLDGIGENETYIPENTDLASAVEVGDIIQVNFSLPISYSNYTALPVNLTVMGFAQLDNEASAIASGYTRWLTPFAENVEVPKSEIDILMLVSWEKTMQKILNIMESSNLMYQPVETSLLVYLNREALINPWDIGTSINNIEVVKNSVSEKIVDILEVPVTVSNNLDWPLRYFQIMSIAIRFSFTLVSLPIFFMAWYMGTTVSDVSFNLRRREIGLLLTKGFSRGQILRTFLVETFLIGTFGGILGILLGFLLNPLFTQLSFQSMFNLTLITPFTISFTVSFGIAIAFLSTFSSARKASQLPTVDALREYFQMESEKSYRKKLTWLALILGTYKIAVFLVGIDMTSMLTRVIFGGGGNFILILLVGIFMFIDAILNYIGPLLFFWGFTKLFIQGSLEFQQLTARAAKFLGDLGALATKNVKRNPARSAAIAFLIALIVGYSVQVTGQLATEQDYAVRQNYFQVGADITVHVAYPNEAPKVLANIMANFSTYIQNATIEYSISTSSVSDVSMQLKAIEPDSWLKSAYYEYEWFSGNDLTTAFSNLSSDRNTTILERIVAASLNLNVGENISVRFGAVNRKLRIIGFFGPEPSSQQQQIMPQQTFTQLWSYIPKDLYEEMKNYVSASARILLKLKSGVNGKTVAEDIRNSDDTLYVESFVENWEKAQTNVISIGMLDVQRLGIVFAVLAASVGTVLISVVSIRERSREATIMSVKGLSYKQLVIMFLTENLALVVFSVLLGLLVGFIVVYGNISAANSMSVYLVKRHLVFPLDTTLMLTSCLTLIFAATILPILIMSRRYVTKLEKMVRLR